MASESSKKKNCWIIIDHFKQGEHTYILFYWNEEQANLLDTQWGGFLS